MKKRGGRKEKDKWKMRREMGREELLWSIESREEAGVCSHAKGR